jgi:hypothetical protein
MARDEFELIIEDVPTEAKQQERKKQLEKEGKKEVPRKDDKELTIKEYISNEDPKNRTLIYKKIRHPGNPAKPL